MAEAHDTSTMPGEGDDGTEPRSLGHLSDLERARPSAERPMVSVLAFLLVLNLMDAIATLLWVTLGLTTEENPLMEVALDAHPILFMGIKLGLVALAVVLLFRYRHLTLARWAAGVLSAVYYVIVLFHAWFYGAVLLPFFLWGV